MFLKLNSFFLITLNDSGTGIVCLVPTEVTGSFPAGFMGNRMGASEPCKATVMQKFAEGF